MNYKAKNINEINENIFILLCILINLFLGVPFFLVKIIKKKKFIFLVIFFSILAFYYIPEEGSDLKRYYDSFYNLSLREEIFSYQKDIYTKSLINFLIKYNLSKNLLAFISAFILYYFMFKSFFLCLEKNKIENKKFFLFFLISIKLTAYSGVRFFPAISVFIYSIIIKYKIHSKKYIIYMLSSLCLHFALIVPVVLFLTNEILMKKLSIKFLKRLLLFSFILGIMIDMKFFTLFNIFENNPYITGIFGLGYERNVSLLFFIRRILTVFILPKAIIFYYLLIIKKNSENELDKYMFILGIFCFLLQNLPTIFGRYFFIFFYIVFITNMKNKFLVKKEKKYNFLYLLLIFFSIVILIYEIKDNYFAFYNSYKNFKEISLINLFFEIKELY